MEFVLHKAKNKKIKITSTFFSSFHCCLVTSRGSLKLCFYRGSAEITFEFLKQRGFPSHYQLVSATGGPFCFWAVSQPYREVPVAGHSSLPGRCPVCCPKCKLERSLVEPSANSCQHPTITAKHTRTLLSLGIHLGPGDPLLGMQ